MSEPQSQSQSQSLDVLGVGIGPANIGLAVALYEANDPRGPDLGPRARGRAGAAPKSAMSVPPTDATGALPTGAVQLRSRGPMSCLFVDQNPAFCWHPGLLLPESVIQDTFIEDGVTLRNPRSYFTFIHYLYLKGRLQAFNNLRAPYPTRLEYNDYLTWVCKELSSSMLRFGERVVSIAPEAKEDRHIKRIAVNAIKADGSMQTYSTRNLVIGTGAEPRIPTGLTLPANGRAFHASELLTKIDQVCPDRNAEYRLVIVGSGQSGGEVFDHLSRTYPNARVKSALRHLTFRTQDDSAFTWDLYYRSLVDYFYRLPDARKQEVVRDSGQTNYSVISMRVLNRIYETMYTDRVLGKKRVTVLSNVELTEITERPNGTVIAYFKDLDTGGIVEEPCDALVLATGYKRRVPAWLESLDTFFDRDDKGNYVVTRDYRISSLPELTAQVFLQGFAAHTHGIGEGQLAIIPQRTEQVLESILESVGV